jgi:hypothetical protein
MMRLMADAWYRSTPHSQLRAAFRAVERNAATERKERIVSVNAGDASSQETRGKQCDGSHDPDHWHLLAASMSTRSLTTIGAPGTKQR